MVQRRGAGTEHDGDRGVAGAVLRSEWQVLGTGVTQLFVRAWEPGEGAPRAVVCLAHGHGEHGERYAHVAEVMALSGYAFIAYDHYGHGRSGGKRGHMLSMEAAIADMTVMLEQCAKRHPDAPIFLYGHSMGGNIALNCALRTKPAIEGLILTSPWLRLAFKPPAVKEWIGRGLSSIWPSMPMSTGLKEEDLFLQDGSERKLRLSMKGDSLSHTTLTPKAYVEIHDAGEWAIKHGAELHVPLLLLHGTEDRITSFEASRQLAEAAGDGCLWRPWQGGLHELHNDSQGDETITYIMAWMNDKLNA